MCDRILAQEFPFEKYILFLKNLPTLEINELSKENLSSYLKTIKDFTTDQKNG